MSDPKDLLNPRQLAERIGVSEGAVRRWVEKSWIPYYKLGALYKFDLEEVLRAVHRPATRLATPYSEIRA